MQSVPGSGHLVAGRYRLVEQLGRGAMGIVWRGRDELLDRDVAVKQIVPAAIVSATQAQASYQRTLREARTAARLSHPGVVTVFDVVEEQDTPWIVMELIRARPLDQVIAEDGPLPPAQAAQLGLSLLDALATAHDAGVLHRDVKPSNVLISPEGKAVLTDFGIATIQGDPGLTQAGMVMGTPGFSPPERVRGAEATPASDLWSLGATLYAAVEGRGPFDRAGGSMAIVASIATEPAPRAPSAGPLGPVIEALLRADPAQRPDAAATAAMLAEALDAARAPDLAPWAFGGATAAPVPGLGRPARQDAGLPVAVEVAGVAGVAGPVLAKAPGAEAAAVAIAGPVPALASLDATTATQVVGVQVVTDPGAPAAIRAADGAVLGAAVGPAAESGADGPAPVAAVRIVPDLMATPVFADLKMPTSTSTDDQLFLPDSFGPVTADLNGSPLLPGAAAPGDAAPGGTAAADAALDRPGGPGGVGDPAAAPGRAGAGSAAPSTAGPAVAAGGHGTGRQARGYSGSGRARRRIALLATAGVAAVVIAIFSLAFPTARDSLLSKLPGGSLVGAGATPAPTRGAQGGKHGHRAAHHGTSGGRAPGGSHSHHPGPTPTGSSHHSGGHSPTATPTPSGSSPGSPSPSASPSPSPTPSQSPSPTALPPGYIWQSESAPAGAVAGFKVATPGTWVLTPGIDSFIKPPRGAARLGIDMDQFAYQWPVRQAKYLQATAIAQHTYHGYHLVSILATRYHGFAAASWTFSWKPLTAASRWDVTAIVFTAKTSAGSQPYVLSMSAPISATTWASHVMRVAMRTFMPLF